jgi:hypothetical protein
MTVKKPLPFKSAVTAVASPGVDYPSHTPKMGIPNVFVDHSPYHWYINSYTMV